MKRTEISRREEKKILLIGRTGRGKSTLANVLTGTNDFQEGAGGVSQTKSIQYQSFSLDNLDNDQYLIIDTPGIGDTKFSSGDVLNIIADAVFLVRKGVHQILFVTSDRFDPYEIATYNILRSVLFDDNVTD